jgi:release factor glutamine methyltransferase
MEAPIPAVLAPTTTRLPPPLAPLGVHRVLDLGTGPGTLLLALLDGWHGAIGLGVDRAPAAAQQAQANAAALGLWARAQFAVMDWGAGLADTARFDVIIANPPYITTAEMQGLSPEVAGFDPPLALAGGDDGLRDYPVIAALARRHLAPGGRLLLEHGHQQRKAVAAIVQTAGFEHWAGWDDLGGQPRALLAWTG